MELRRSAECAMREGWSVGPWLALVRGDGGLIDCYGGDATAIRSETGAVAALTWGTW